MTAPELYRKLLLTAGMRCQDVAKKMGVSPVQLSRWMRHPEKMRLDTLAVMTSFLDEEDANQVIRLYMTEVKEKAAGYTRTADKKIQ